MQISNYFFYPTLASLIEKRQQTFLLSGVAAVQIGLVTAGLPGWPCPIKAAFGIPCPGCGLSTSISCLFHGDWYGAFTTHAFAPIFLVALVFMLMTSILPETMRKIVVEKVALLEKKTGITTLLMMGFISYWGFRLIRL